jgi:hypothetical protein
VVLGARPCHNPGGEEVPLEGSGNPEYCAEGLGSVKDMAQYLLIFEERWDRFGKAAVTEVKDISRRLRFTYRSVSGIRSSLFSLSVSERCCPR